MLSFYDATYHKIFLKKFSHLMLWTIHYVYKSNALLSGWILHGVPDYYMVYSYSNKYFKVRNYVCTYSFVNLTLWTFLKKSSKENTTKWKEKYVVMYLQIIFLCIDIHMYICTLLISLPVIIEWVPLRKPVYIWAYVHMYCIN